MIKLNRNEWLQKIPEELYNLVSKYNFYFSGRYSIITKDLDEVMKKFKKKRSSGLVLYKTEGNRFYFIIYTKRGDTIYYTDDYVGASWSSVKYFMEKFNKRYSTAEKARFFARCGVPNGSN